MEPSNDSIIQEKIDEMLGDPLLFDIRPDITVEEVNSLIALEYGQAMTIHVNRADGKTYSVIVNQNASVSDLKSAIRRHVTLQLQRESGPAHISWKYVWRAYWLYFQGQKLKEDRKKLKDYGIRIKDELCFVKRLREK